MLLFLSCSKEKELNQCIGYSQFTVINNFNIVGEWKLYSICSGWFLKSDYEQLLKFKENGKFMSDETNQLVTGSYNVESSEILFVFDSIPYQNFYWSSKDSIIRFLGLIDQNHISISPYCTEGCQYLFERVR